MRFMIRIVRVSLKDLIIREFTLFFVFLSCLISFYRCPWTGTAIGDKNMAAFQSFVALVFICLIMDILLLSGLFERK